MKDVEDVETLRRLSKTRKTNRPLAALTQDAKGPKGELTCSWVDRCRQAYLSLAVISAHRRQAGGTLSPAFNPPGKVFP